MKFSLIFSVFSVIKALLTLLIAAGSLNLRKGCPKLRNKSVEFFDFLNFFSYWRYINATNCFLIASRSLNLRKDFPKILKRSMKFFLNILIFSGVNVLLTPLMAC